MEARSGKVATALALLAAVWIAVYWWWDAGPRVSVGASLPIDTPKVVEPTPTPEATQGTSTHLPPPVIPAQQERQPHVDPQPPAPVVQKTETSQAPEQLPVIPPRFTQHTIQDGDTLAELSRKYYGSSKHADAISKANGLTDTKRLKIGRTLQIPVDPRNIQGLPNPAYPKPAVEPAKALPAEYTVEKGDTLSRIAKRLYNDSSLARTIYEANRDVLPDEDSLKIGMKLKIPPKP